MTVKQSKITFNDFINRFPEIELPITLNTETHHLFSAHNQPISDEMINRFLLSIEDDTVDEFTEYVPCFRLENTGDFYAIVYWKAGLLSYEYFLATFTKKGELIDKKLIASTLVEGEEMSHQIATIEIDWQIHIVKGYSKIAHDYDPTSSKVENLEILESGEVITQYEL